MQKAPRSSALLHALLRPPHAPPCPPRSSTPPTPLHASPHSSTVCLPPLHILLAPPSFSSVSLTCLVFSSLSPFIPLLPEHVPWFLINSEILK